LEKLEHIKNFEKLKKFQLEQEKQKQRGLNSYNILTSVLKKNDEVRLHSRMMLSFLNPNGTHYQSNLFLDKFLEVLNIDGFTIDTKHCSVYTEYKNIDLYITDGTKHIIIENKIYAGDQPNQIERYVEIIEEENHSLTITDMLVIYLSLDRDYPSKDSLGNLTITDNFLLRDEKNIALFKSIHYKNEILEWLELCQYEIQNISNLNESFKQYIDVVKMITNQYKEKIMSLADYIQENKSIYKMALEIQDTLPVVRKKIIDDFFEKVINLLQRELGTDWIVELKGNLSKRHSFPLRIYKKAWIGNKNNNLIFGFEFDKNNYYKGCFGIVRQSKSVIIKNDITDKFKNEFDNLNYNLRTTQWWLHWLSLPDTKDFTEYIIFNENTEDKFVNEVYNLIQIFEIDSNLMTDINSYLNSKN